MTFNFSIRVALKDSWNMFVRHWQFYAVLAFVMVILNLFSQSHKHNVILTIVVVVAAVVWSYVWISVALAAVDGKEDLLNFGALSMHLPTFKEFFMIIGISLLTGLIVGGGFILLIIPGVYFVTRLAFANISYVDRQGSVWGAMKYSWHLVHGTLFWTVFLVILIEVVLVVLGSLVFFIGTLVTYPLAMLLVTHLYRALQNHQAQLDAPAEVEA